MLARSMLLLTATGILSSACAANKMDVLKERASSVMTCPKGELSTAQIGAESTQQVNGCGKQELFAAAPSGGWVHVADLRRRASVDLSCPPDQLSLTAVGAGPTMAVEGCSKRATYVYTVMSSTKYNTVFDWVPSGAAAPK